MNIFENLAKTLFQTSIGRIFSDQGKERTALNVAARFARGNTNIQHGRVTTSRDFENEIERMKSRAASTLP